MRIAATTAAALAAAAAVIGTTGCLDPLVKDTPGASTHLLPAGTTVPNAVDNPDLKVQITLNDGLDDATFMANAGVVLRGTGMSGGSPVRFWSFGPATQAPSPIYKFFQMTASGLVPIAHPALLDALPGDHGYGPIHEINQVVVTDAYNGELITTIDALADAIDLGLVNQPTPVLSLPGMTTPGKYFVDCPVVLPNTKLDVGGTASTAMPEMMYARGYTVWAFEFGGAPGIQAIPAGGVLMPTSQVSFLREPQKIYDTTRPIFQATIPTVMPPPLMPSYTPLSVVVNVDLAPGFPASMITKDSDLFMRKPTGEITGTTSAVMSFQVTTSIQLLQLQFMDGMP